MWRAWVAVVDNTTMRNTSSSPSSVRLQRVDPMLDVASLGTPLSYHRVSNKVITHSIDILPCNACSPDLGLCEILGSAFGPAVDLFGPSCSARPCYSNDDASLLLP